MIANLTPNSDEYRKAVEEAKDRIISYLKVMRKDYPKLFEKCSLIHTEVVNDRIQKERCY